MKSSIPTSHDYRSPGEAIDGITDFVQQHECARFIWTVYLAAAYLTLIQGRVRRILFHS